MESPDMLSHPTPSRLPWLLLPLLAAACSPAVDSTPTPSAESVAVDVERYDLKGEFDWSRSRLAATVNITLAPLPDGAGKITLDSAVTEVKAVRLDGEDLPFSVDVEGEQLTMDVSRVPDLARIKKISLAIDYEAAPSESLVPVPVRKGDPIAVRTVYTASEPLGVARWMPCHNTPSDRALFSVDMRMDNGETMIANGGLVGDTPDTGASHRMKYETAYTLPTYLMAFAIGEFEVASTTKGDLPVSVWRRRGASGDYDMMLKELVRLIARYEELLVPYPFEKYALVLLPDFSSGGIEHASVTFQREVSSAEPRLSGDLILTAHELSHQWFGDLVTIKSWDDVWIKEGMATLLEHEGARIYTDEDGKGTLNGDAFFPENGVAIRDTSLKPDQKYTSGAYSRAAWLLSQIRSLIGEDAFWKTLRGVLEEHRFSAIGTEEFLDAFAPALGPDVTARALRAVDAAALPSLTVEAPPSGGAFLTVRDPDGALLAPMNLSWLAASGSVRTQTLNIGERIAVSPQQSGEILVLDPLDRDPDWGNFTSTDGDAGNYYSTIVPLRTPTSSEQITRLLDASGAHQLAVLSNQLPPMAPESFKDFVKGLDAETAKAVSIKAACQAASDPGLDPQIRAGWTAVLEQVVLEAPYTFGLPYVAGGYAACSGVLSPGDLFAAEWSQLVTGLPAGGISEARLFFLSRFRLSAPTDLSTWASVVTRSSSLRARRIAIQHLRSYVQTLEPEGVPAFRDFFVGLLSETEASEVLQTDISAVVATMAGTAAENEKALAGLGQVLRSPGARSVHAQAVCAAFKLTNGDAAAFAQFVAKQEGVAFTPEVQVLIGNPSNCL
jgi:aminopeptidase N